jgi:hypothetical protein
MWWRKKPVEARLDAELRYHFDRLVRESLESGMKPGEARRRARLEFGGLRLAARAACFAGGSHVALRHHAS